MSGTRQYYYVVSLLALDLNTSLYGRTDIDIFVDGVKETHRTGIFSQRMDGWMAAVAEEAKAAVVCVCV